MGRTVEGEDASVPQKSAKGVVEMSRENDVCVIVVDRLEAVTNTLFPILARQLLNVEDAIDICGAEPDPDSSRAPPNVRTRLL